jgi:hypothetical protein
MGSYAEEEIRAAWNRATSRIEAENLSQCTIDVLISELRKKDHVHDFADTDTITVKELREAWRRANAPASVAIANFAMLLTDISSHREPEHPYASTWKDDNGVVWQRAMDGNGKVNMWLRMGHAGKFSDSQPKRPLKRMDVVS